MLEGYLLSRESKTCYEILHHSQDNPLVVKEVIEGKLKIINQTNLTHFNHYSTREALEEALKEKLKVSRELKPVPKPKSELTEEEARLHWYMNRGFVTTPRDYCRETFVFSSGVWTEEDILMVDTEVPVEGACLKLWELVIHLTPDQMGRSVLLLAPDGYNFMQENLYGEVELSTWVRINYEDKRSMEFLIDRKAKTISYLK